MRTDEGRGFGELWGLQGTWRVVFSPIQLGLCMLGLRGLQGHKQLGTERKLTPLQILLACSSGSRP